MISADRLRIDVSIVFFVVVFAGCSGGAGANISDTTAPTVETTSQPSITSVGKTPNAQKKPLNLDSVLYKLTEANRPKRFASNHSLTLKDGRVEVMIELMSGRDLPQKFNIQIESRRNELVQATVPVDELRSLSEHQNVSYIRTAPSPAVNQPPRALQ
jgi:PBP1b-binding outer membrane lipoprotein LpoB